MNKNAIKESTFATASAVKPLSRAGSGAAIKSKQFKLKTYDYDDLSEKAKEKALERFSDMNVDYEDWYGDYPYEAIKEIGVSAKHVYFKQSGQRSILVF